MRNRAYAVGACCRVPRAGAAGAAVRGGPCGCACAECLGSGGVPSASAALDCRSISRRPATAARSTSSSISCHFRCKLATRAWDAALAGFLAYSVARQFDSPGPLVADTTLVVPAGAGLQSIAQILHSPWGESGAPSAPLPCKTNIGVRAYVFSNTDNCLSHAMSGSDSSPTDSTKLQR